MIKQIIFDLDGTLIDSAQSILSGFRLILDKFNISAQIPLNEKIIGPPLTEILPLICGSNDAILIEQLAREFKVAYDSEGYRQISVFPQVVAMLDQLKRRKIPLFIATNKRINPTRKICQYLAWEEYFQQIYALDYFTPALSSKAAMLKQILQENSFAASESLYLGDRDEDGIASSNNNMPFILATWGYSGETIQEWQKIAEPLAIINYLD